MAYDEELAERVRAGLGARDNVTERRMFGGVAWMVAGNMACGVLGEELIVRLEPEEAEAALARPDTRPFDATGRPMRGFVMIDPTGLTEDSQLDRWVESGANRAASLPPK